MRTLCVEGLSVGYAKKPLLSGINMQVEAGQVIAILGENGCGKTTLLRTLAGELAPLTGNMLVNGTDISALSVKGRAALVAFMAQELSAQPGLCGMDRIELSFYRQKGLFGRLTQEERERIKHEADRFGIAHLLQQDLVRMSAGERQMVLLLCVALQETPLLLLDEPASALDFNRTEQLFMLLRYLCKKGRTVLIVLHDPTQALRYADKLCLIHHGCAELLDPAACDRLYLESSLRKIYPRLRIHGDPLFCYADEDGCDA